MRLARFLPWAAVVALMAAPALGAPEPDSSLYGTATQLPNSGFTKVSQRMTVIEPRLSYEISACYQSLYPAALDHGGSVGSQQIEFRAQVSWRPTAEFSAGIVLHYDMQDWEFEPGQAFGSLPPWDALEHGVIVAPVEFLLAPPMGLMAAPFVEWAYEREAGASDALTFGSRVGIFGVVSPERRAGIGVTWHHRYFDTGMKPFWLVDWQLTDRLRLQNSVASSPQGPEGVELAWSLLPEWELAVGGVQLGDRFRLEPEGMEHGDLAEPSGTPVYARLSWQPIARLRADLYGGAVAAARIRRWDPDGVTIVDEDVAAVPMLAMVVSSHW